jgi:hypothetical protein
MVELVPSKCEALSSNSSMGKKGKKAKYKRVIKEPDE